MGDLLKSNAPFMCASAERRGLRLDGRRRFKVVVAWSTSLSQMCRGKLGLTLDRPAMKWSFQVPMAFSAGLERWSWGATSW